MTQHAYTFVPEVALDEHGQEHFTGEGQLNPQRSGGSYETPYQLDDQTGERIYNLTNNDFAQDGDFIPTDLEESYVEAILQTYPDLHLAQEWALRNYPPEKLEDFNNAMESFNPDEMMPRIEELMENYENSLPDEPHPNDVEELDIPSEEEIYSAFDEGQMSEPEGLETAYEWMDLAEQTQTSNPVFSDVARLTAMFHNGEISSEDAWATALEKHPLHELKKVYNHLKRLN